MEKQTGHQMRFSEQELSIIRNTFKNDEILKLLRKVFLPELDPTLPLGQMIDLWMTIDLKDRTPEENMVNLIARNTLIMHIEQQLMQLKILANQEETPKDKAEKILKDSKDSSK